MASKLENKPGDVIQYDPGDVESPAPVSTFMNSIVAWARISGDGTVRSSRGFAEKTGANVRTALGTYFLTPIVWSDLDEQRPITYIFGQTISAGVADATLSVNQLTGPGRIDIKTFVGGIDSDIQFCIIVFQGTGPGI